MFNRLMKSIYFLLSYPFIYCHFRIPCCSNLIVNTWKSMLRIMIYFVPFSNFGQRRPCSGSSFRGLGWWKRVTFHCWEPRPVDIQGILGTINEKREALEGMTSKLDVLNHIKHMFCWRMPWRYHSCNMCWEHRPLTCVEELRIFDGALFDSLGRVANVSLEGDECKQAGFPVNYGSLGCRRAGDIALPSFLAFMNSVGELVETILSWMNIADTNELAETVESWRRASGCAPLPDDPIRQRAWHLPICWEKLGKYIAGGGSGV